MEFKVQQTEVIYFVHHFPTHSTVWEVWETNGYNTLSDASEIYSGSVEFRDGSIYQVYEPIMMRRTRAEEYVKGAQDNEFNRYTVIEIK